MFGRGHPEATLDVGQALVALHHLSRPGIGVGHQQQLAVELLEVALARVVDGEAEGIGLEIDLDQVACLRAPRGGLWIVRDDEALLLPRRLAHPLHQILNAPLHHVDPVRRSFAPSD